MLIGTAEQQKQGSINFVGQKHQMSELSSAAGAIKQFVITTKQKQLGLPEAHESSSARALGRSECEV